MEKKVSITLTVDELNAVIYLINEFQFGEDPEADILYDREYGLQILKQNIQLATKLNKKFRSIGCSSKASDILNDNLVYYNELYKKYCLGSP